MALLVSKIELIGVQVEVKKERFDLFKTIVEAIHQSGEQIVDGDILVVSSKFSSLSQGRFVKLADIKASPEASKLAVEYRLPEKLAELVVRESDSVFGGVFGFLLTVKDGLFAPNAGIDRSNIHPGYAILYPNRPSHLAEQLRRAFLIYLGRKIGVILVDSRLLPGRRGTTGVTVAVAGFKPVEDERGRKDLFGNIMRVTSRAVADDVAAAAQLLMGETDEARPVVIVRNSGIKIFDKAFKMEELTISPEECVYLRGLVRDLT